MSVKIGIFKKEQQAIDAIHALEEEGFSKTELQVFARDHEHSQRVESDTDVHADEMEDLTDTRDHDGAENGLNIPVIGLAAVGMTGGAGTTTSGSMPYYGLGILAASGMLSDDSAMEDALQALGLSEGDAEKCRDAIAEGALVVTADTGADQPPAGGGPDLSRSGAAEAAFRRSGAESIL